MATFAVGHYYSQVYGAAMILRKGARDHLSFSQCRLIVRETLPFIVDATSAVFDMEKVIGHHTFAHERNDTSGLK